MKRKILSITMILLLIGAGTVSALVYHINDAADNLKNEYKEEVEVYQSEKDIKIKNDVSHITQQEIERMQTETRDYLNQRLGDDYQDSLNEKSDEIQKVTDEKIEEIKQYIDELLSAE
ncbi:hypothetical protein SAMN05216232_3932 [Virgibacillus subterraneus]|uniref:Uncharacterized protein n=1 Tax=Virgibacillus subterraneus TaxID=621109 RepID=A0A1H9KNE7_9BACI|nr:hypothetical protein [Virgibacillus subterraneus]SER00373.1 hypothetical protein SAMN05216232_3932 [Virgibacillus subterraneus]